MSKKSQNKANPFDLLLDYQKAWVLDDSRFKIWLKSRQIGGSLAAAYEVVADAMQTGDDWIILSAGERQANEFMDKVQTVARIFASAYEAETGKPFNNVEKVAETRLNNGARLLALPANPATARGYSANLVLDEFAFHQNPSEIWRAVYPIISNPLKGDLKLRVISTPAGRNNKFYDLWESKTFSHHKTTVYDAKQQGLDIDIEALKDSLADPDGWAQEFECVFMQSSEQLFEADLVERCFTAGASLDGSSSWTTGQKFIGVDIGRKKDLTVIWQLERRSNQLLTTEVRCLDNVPYPEQEKVILDMIKGAAFVAIDSTGVGGAISENLQTRVGKASMECVVFTNEKKRQLFAEMKKEMQAGHVKLAECNYMRSEFASLTRIVTNTGLVKITAARTADGHADRATALALAIYAASKQPARNYMIDTNQTMLGKNIRRRPARTKYRNVWGRRR
jgi:phage FluMu gp28-like protein